MTTYVAHSEGAINNEIRDLASSLLSCDTPCEHPFLVKKKISKKRSRHVYKFELNNTVYYFKMYSNHSILKYLQDVTRGSRAKRAYEISVHLQKQGFDLASPVAAFTNKFSATNKRSIFVTKELSGEDFLYRFLEDTSEPNQEQNKALLLNLYSKLVSNKIYHRDLNLTNCRLINDKLYLLDVDDVRKVLFFHPLSLLSNFERHNISLLLLCARYPGTWLSNSDREQMMYDLSSNYIHRRVLPLFLSSIFAKSFQKAGKFLSSDEQRESLKQLAIEATKNRQRVL